MNSLYEALFNYAQENRVPRLTHQPECRLAGKNGEFHQGWLEEAVFLAGLSIGLELAALCGLPE